MEDIDMEDIPGQNSPEDRAKVLGFKPQKENYYNRLMPYADKIDEESAGFLSEIKLNLGKAAQIRELKPGCLLWLTRLNR